jgi:hypothetical protein
MGSETRFRLSPAEGRFCTHAVHLTGQSVELREAVLENRTPQAQKIIPKHTGGGTYFLRGDEHPQVCDTTSSKRSAFLRLSA